jgi:thymidylate synthase ThyX
MPNPRQIYLLDPQKLPPETIAVAFAKTSRSPESFRQIAAELSEEKSAQFHEKWVVGYGHSSVAEHAVLHIAVENVSRLAVETLESCRLASYTEKSTRYQKWKNDEFYIPAELENHPLRETYTQTVSGLFEAYQNALPKVQQVVAARIPHKPNESDEAWERRVRSEIVDACRFFLPAAALANVGVSMNARVLEHTIKKMLSHELDEVRQMGEQIKQVSQQTAPTLVKYAEADPRFETLQEKLKQIAGQVPGEPTHAADWCKLAHYDQNAEDRALAAALYRFNNNDYTHNIRHINSLTFPQKQDLAAIILADLGRHDIPLRELEYASYTFDLTLDQGAYFEFKRHRMMTQTAQPLTTRLGYAVPRLLVDAGVESSYKAAMHAAADVYEQLYRYNPAVASYVVPNGFNRRVLFNMNLRSADHLINLRTAPNAHFSIRRVAQRIAEEIRKVTPLLGLHLRCCSDETWQQIEQDYFSEV